MKPDWDRLMKEFENSTTVLIADVDCTAAGEELCSKYGVEGFPTLKYGEATDLQDYEGEREYDDLLNFAKENLGPVCGLKNLDLCDSDQLAKIEALKAEGPEVLAARMKEVQDAIKAAEENFENELQKLEDRYEELMKEMEKEVKEIKGEDFEMLTSIYVHLGGSMDKFGPGPDEMYDSGEDYGSEEDFGPEGYDSFDFDGSEEEWGSEEGYDSTEGYGSENEYAYEEEHPAAGEHDEM